MINDTFVGNDKQVEEYLLKLKASQESLIEISDLKKYRKSMPTFKHSHLHGTFNSLYSHHSRLYNNPDYDLSLFRKKTKPNGLSIKIERYIYKTDKFF